jgi:hypothetical protein
VSEAVVITDADECTLAEGLELSLLGQGFTPWPATPPPRPRPTEGGSE